MQRILLVEDNEMNRDLISRRLKRRGYAVIVATDGAAGVEKATQEKPDLVLMDIGLPLIDGYEATRMIKDNAETRLIPVIGLSAHAMSGDADRALEAGCDDYDTKPIEWPRLLQKIQSLLEKAAEARAAAESSDGSRAAASDTGIRLLVLGESAMRTEMLTGRLASLGHSFLAVTEVASAVEKLVTESFDGVFLDVAVEGRDGKSALEEVRRASMGQPVFIFCAIDAVADAIHCLERGASEYIPQPFRPAELRHRLETHLELAHRRQGPAALVGGSGEERRVEHLMRALLPPTWIDELRQLQKLPPRRLDEVALLQWDLPALAQQFSHSETAAMARLQRVAVGFEEIAERHGAQILDIDNLGVLVMVEAVSQDAAIYAAVQSAMELASLAAETGEPLRVAIHNGPVVAGVIGHRTWRFGLWGGSVTLVQQACHSVAQGVHITDTAFRQINGRINAEHSGGVPIEGGSLNLFRVERTL